MREVSTFFSEQFYSDIWEHFSPTLKSRKSQTDYFAVICDVCDFCKKDYFDITTEDANNFFNHLILECVNEKQTVKTVNGKLMKLRSFSNFILKNSNSLNMYKPYDINPFQYVNSLPSDLMINPNSFPNIDEMDQMLQMAKKSHTLYLVLAMMIRCAFTVGEICNMKVSDFFQDKNNYFGVHIHTYRKQRIVKIPKDIIELLDLYCKTREHQSEWLFSNKRGNPLRIRDLERLYKKYIDMEKFSNPYTMSDLRNGSIAYMLKCGATQHEVSNYIDISVGWLFRYNKAVDELNIAAVDYTNIKIEKFK